ncbi:MAG: GHKL domain-containing protein [Puniceicoccaceae bacterium]|nr:MAG: GHKL domain-containing protein [Puniceicoccaceae bacterium]
MPGRKSSPLDRILGRLDSLDTVNLANLAQRLARERGLLETVFNLIREGILVIDASGVIEYANQAGKTLIGLKDEELGRVTLWRLVPGLEKSLPREAVQAGGSATRELELTYPERRFVRLYLVAFETPAEGEQPESAQRVAVILSDITEERVSTEERIESERVDSILLLAAGVAHELGNPLNSLEIHLQLMERQLKRMDHSPASEKLREAVEVSRSEVGRLDRIIRHFLEAIRPQRPDFQQANLLAILEESLTFLSGELEDRGLKVEVETEVTPPPVLADPNQIKQVLFNLVKNAMEAMREGGRIKFKFRDDDQHVILQIGDSGHGIRSEHLGRVFQPYQSTKRGGHGLGLMIVQRIMREHGGQVGIESKEGIGTVVTLQFPKIDGRVRLLEH